MSSSINLLLTSNDCIHKCSDIEVRNLQQGTFALQVLLKTNWNFFSGFQASNWLLVEYYENTVNPQWTLSSSVVYSSLFSVTA